jgi:hypothetical protein
MEGVRTNVLPTRRTALAFSRSFFGEVVPDKMRSLYCSVYGTRIGIAIHPGY